MKKSITFLLIALSITTFSQSNFKKVSNTDAIIKKLNTASESTKTIDSDFKQFKHLNILENDLESTGHFSFKAKDKVRWEYFQPYKYLIIMNASQMWINDGSKTRKYDTNSNKMFKEINDLMVGMLQGKILGSDKFDIVFLENGKQVLAKLTPKTPEMKEFLSEMQLFFDKKDYNIIKIKMLEHSGDYTLIQFHNRKLNIDLPNSKFIIE